jgi:hypothetical protein
MERLVEKQRPPSVHYAAQYLVGRLEGILEVAQKMDGDAEVAAVTDLEIAVIKYLRVPDDYPMYHDYLVIAEGNWLVYSERADLMYECTPEQFERTHERTR